MNNPPNTHKSTPTREHLCTHKPADRFPSQPLETPTFRRFWIGLSLFVAGFFALLLFPDRTLLWIYYTPLYALLPDTLYLPLYLEIGRNIVFGSLLACIAMPLLSPPRKVVHTIGACVFIALGLLQICLAPASEFRDVPFGGKVTHMTTECDLETLRTGFRERVGSKRSLFRYYRINSARQPAVTLEMDIRQYEKALKIKNMNAATRTMNVVYTSHSARVLRFESETRDNL
ncbi:MAG: hypothetical protein LBV38_06775 [Alistipes sp.]|jgi:hypothetical protein|nr:hypothetical protein [Alistipes sp.]